MRQSRMSALGPMRAASLFKGEGRLGPTGPAFGRPDDKLRPSGQEAPPVFRAFVRTLERLEAERQASRPAREGAR
jgi:hypothetical protein